KTAKVLVSNVFGVWFEVQRREDYFECHRLARKQLKLKDHPLPGINYKQLAATGEPLSIESRSGSRLGQRPPLEPIENPEPDQGMAPKEEELDLYRDIDSEP